MKETTRKHLRVQVLELRTELRGYVKELATVNRERERIQNSILDTANEIRGIQEDCGDQIEIDPQNPELH